MRFIHIADLHIGKRINEFNMEDDQKHILQEILRITDDVDPVGIIMAGDIYDKSVPAGEAVGILDDFLTELVERKIQLFIVITGNNRVTDKVIDLLGIDFRQFKQIAMIAQGEFLKLLHAESKERADIFRKVFNTDIYQNIQDILKRCEKDLKEQCDKDNGNYVLISELMIRRSIHGTAQIIELLNKLITEDTATYCQDRKRSELNSQSIIAQAQ